MMWRHMNRSELSIVYELSLKIHPNYPERPEVFDERLRLYPSGCFVCIRDGLHVGYAITHPWEKGKIPELDSLLESIPAVCESYYLHDVAIESGARRFGAGAEIVRIVKEYARAHSFRWLGLVAVNNSTEFWKKQGFSVLKGSRSALSSYDDSCVYMECQL